MPLAVDGLGSAARWTSSGIGPWTWNYLDMMSSPRPATRSRRDWPDRSKVRDATMTKQAPSGKPSRLVTTIAWLFIVMSILLTVVAATQYVAFLLTLADLESSQPMVGWPARLSTAHLLALSRVAMGLALFFAAFGLLRRWRWARHALLVLASIGVATNAYRLIAAVAAPSPMPLPVDAAPGEVWIIRIGGFLSHAYPLAVCLFIGWVVVKLMSRPVRDGFRR